MTTHRSSSKEDLELDQQPDLRYNRLHFLIDNLYKILFEDPAGMAQASIGIGFINLKAEDVDLIERFMTQPRPPIGDSADSDDEDGSSLSIFSEPEDLEMIEAEVLDQTLAETRFDSPEPTNELSEARATSITPPPTFECICFETFIDKESCFHLSCGCVRCFECLNNNVRVGIEARKTWPPRCHDCNEKILFDAASPFIEHDLRVRWIEVQPEYDDLSPVYCDTPDCHKYVPKQQFLIDEKWGLCTRCNARTCTACGNLESKHDRSSKSCPDTVEKASLEEMRRKGYKPCPWCKQMIERIDGCDHMHCEPCGKNFCYNCGRKKGRSELPCNCRGDHDWVEQDIRDMDPEAQQDILDRIQNGMLLPRGRFDVRDLELLPHGRFLGFGQRVGEQDGEENREEQEEWNARPLQAREPLDEAFNHWRAIQENQQIGFFPRNRFHGPGQRLGDEDDIPNNEGSSSSAEEDDDSDDAFGDLRWRRGNPRNQPRRIPNFHAFGQGQRLGEAPGIENADNHMQEDEMNSNDPTAPRDLLGINAEEGDPQLRRGRFRSQGRRFGELDAQTANRAHPDQSLLGLNEYERHISEEGDEHGDGYPVHHHFHGSGRRLGVIAGDGPDDVVGLHNQQPGPSAVLQGFNHWNGLNHDHRNVAAPGRGRHRRQGFGYGYGQFGGVGHRLGD